eukprot:8955583-Alexandrium_andersonii.AAC.1
MQFVHRALSGIESVERFRSSIAHVYRYMLHASCSGTECTGTGADSCRVRAHGTPGRACFAVCGWSQPFVAGAQLGLVAKGCGRAWVS